MKKIVLLLAFVTFTLSVFAADITISFTIPDAKVQKVKALWPVPTDEQDKPVMTDKQWFEKTIKKLFNRSVYRGLVTKAKREAGKLIIKDNDILQ